MSIANLTSHSVYTQHVIHTDVTLECLGSADDVVLIQRIQRIQRKEKHSFLSFDASYDESELFDTVVRKGCLKLTKQIVVFDVLPYESLA